MPEEPAAPPAEPAPPAAAPRTPRSAFAVAVADYLRASRKTQRLTQAALAARTGGMVTKAALANYETGHRSLRVDIFWALAKALGEDPGTIFAAAEWASGFGSVPDEGPIAVDVAAIRDSDDERLAPVRRWFAMRLQASGARLAVRTITLDHGALAALAELMGVTVSECRSLLAQTGGASEGTLDARVAS